MTTDLVYWAATVAPLSDASLLRFMDACEAQLDKYQAALTAAITEAQRRNLIARETKTCPTLS